MTEILLIGTLINQSINQDKHRAKCLVLKFGLNLCVCASREGLSQAAYAQAYLTLDDAISTNIACTVSKFVCAKI